MGIYIVGAGGAGREAWGMALENNIKVDGFLDEQPGDVGRLGRVITDPLSFDWKPIDKCILAVGDCRRKKYLHFELSNRNVEFISLVHHLAVRTYPSHLGVGCIVYPFANISIESWCGNFVLININSIVSHDSKIGDYCTLGPQTSILGKATLGESVFLGAHSVVLPGIRIADYVTIGAGAVVTKDIIEPGIIVKGVPAR